MRIDCKKDISFSDFKKALPDLFIGYNVDLREKAYIREFEKATGQSYGKVKESPKERAKVGKRLAKDKESGA